MIVDKNIIANPKIKYKNSNILITKDFERILFNLLEAADYKNRPQTHIKNDGSVSYTYKKDRFKPELSIEEIKKIINNGEDLKYEKKYIKFILNYIRNMNIDLALIKDKSLKNTALWIPAENIVQIHISLLDHGTRKFSEMLNHEVIHIAQSCHSENSINPVLLNLDKKLTIQNLYYIDQDIYKTLSPYRRKLELEAYSNQSNLKLGVLLMKKYCLRKLS